ncbi:MAG: type II secretion system F family protein [Acidimicrobiia bacterium]|nr:type II secretion system F family protein [Acidimicrobiia bacterium]
MLGAKLVLPLLIGGVLAVRMMDNLTVRGALIWCALVFAGFFMPDLMIRSKADRRAEEITIMLPDLLDQLTISVEAGLGFEAALDRIIQREDHALAQEFNRMLQDIRLGTSRPEALEALAKRSQVDDLRTVMLTLRQAEMLGVPLAESLRNVSAEMREKRRFRAEEKANQLPIKMIFPLGICILPALFIVILGPAVVRFTQLF